VAGDSPAGELSAALAGAPLRPARSSAGAPRRNRFTYRLAQRDDAGALARLLRGNPFDGAIRLSFEGEPDPLAAAAVYGPVHQTIVAEDRGRIVAMACRAERDCFVNGRVARVAYLCQLRVDRSVRIRRELLAGGFAFCRALHDEGDACACLVSIVDDNRPAMRLLTSARIPDAPAMRPLEPFVTFAIPVRQGWRAGTTNVPAGGARIERGRPDLTEPIVECLQRYGERHQLAPLWTAEDLVSPSRMPTLRIEDFLVMREGGRVTACLATWDQRSFRQTVVRGYSPWLARVRPAVNLAARAGWAPRLPTPGATLSFAYLSHMAFDDDAERLLGLVDVALAEAGRTGLEFLVLGAATRHPLAHAVSRRYRHRRYVSRLYLAHWPEDGPLTGTIDGRVPHPEVAVL